MRFEYDFILVRKFAAWARNLPDNIDFIDYWYNLSLSETKHKIEEHPANKINAFHWTRWQEDFEQYVDSYVPIISDELFYYQEREWFAMNMQYLVYAFQVPSREIASYYSKDLHREIFFDWHKYHTFGVDQFVENIVIKYGQPLVSKHIILLHR